MPLYARLRLNTRELALLKEALDSHKYWQLSDDVYRCSGDVLEPGSDDPLTQLAIARTDALIARLEELTLAREPKEPSLAL